MIWPIKNLVSYKVIQIYDKKPYISQGFGENPQIYAQFGMKGHNGIDIAADTGTPIYASHAGRVRYTTDTSGYGGHARITDSEKETIYGHMSKFEGTSRNVKEGDVIGYVGSTGFSTGPHLHFGIKVFPINNNNGYSGSIDPMPFLKSMNQTKPYLAKDGKTILLVTPMAMDFENFKKQASIEGIEIPNPIPPVSEL